MTSIKEKVLKHISNSNDERLMHDIARLIEIDRDENAVEFLTEAEKEKLKFALDQIKSNQIIPSEQADNEIDKWLGK